MIEYLEIIPFEKHGWKRIVSDSDWSGLYVREGDENLFLSFTPQIDPNISNTHIWRDCNKQGEAFKDKKYTKFMGNLKTESDYENIVRYLNLKQ